MKPLACLLAAAAVLPLAADIVNEGGSLQPSVARAVISKS